MLRLEKKKKENQLLKQSHQKDSQNVIALKVDKLLDNHSDRGFLKSGIPVFKSSFHIILNENRRDQSKTKKIRLRIVLQQ